MPMYRIDSLHPDRLVCEACATAIGAVTFSPGQVPWGALPDELLERQEQGGEQNLPSAS
jgi:hypothetical protein